MKKTLFRPGLATTPAALLLLAATQNGLGQQSYQNSRAWEQVTTARRKNTLENNYYNLRAGPVDLSFTAGMSLEYNSNINASAINPSSDFILSPGVHSSAVWVVTEINRLSLDLDVGYVKYIENSQLDRMRISPGSLSQIDYDFYVSIFRINVHDRFSYTTEVATQSQLTGQASLGRFDNTLGVATAFNLKDWTFSLGYDHSWDVYSSGFTDNSRESEMFFARGGYEISPAVTVGMEASMGITTFSETIRGNSVNYTAGPYVTWQVSDHIALDVRAGMSIYQQDQASQFLVPDFTTNPPTLKVVTDDSSPTGIYASVDMRHQVNEWLSHTLSVTRSTQQAAGVFSNYYESMSFDDSASWRIFNKVSFGTRLGYEIGKLSATGTTGEEYTRFSIGAYSSYQLMEKLSSTLGYDFTKRGSNRSLGYNAHRVTLSFNYRF